VTDDEQKAEEAATVVEQEGESFKERLMSLIAERKKKGMGLVIPRNAAMVCTLSCQEVIFEGSEKCPRCGHQGLPYRDFEAMVFGDLAAEIDRYPVSIRGKEFSLVIHKDVAMVCTRLGCQVIFKDAEKCPLCGHQAQTYREIEAKVFEALAAEIDPDPVSIRKVLTRRAQ
jgi:rubrerythrin